MTSLQSPPMGNPLKLGGKGTPRGLDRLEFASQAQAKAAGIAGRAIIREGKPVAP